MQHGESLPCVWRRLAPRVARRTREKQRERRWRRQQAFSELGAPLPLVPQGERWIALLPCADSQAAARNRPWLVQLLAASHAPLRLFLGLSSGEHRPEHFAMGLSEARQALQAAQTFPERLGLCCSNELGVLRRQRVETLSRRSPDDPLVRLDIAVALMIRRLFSCQLPRSLS
ncbi:hypothetical protein D3C78_457290 [compost metagenome]